MDLALLSLSIKVFEFQFEFSASLSLYVCLCLCLSVCLSVCLPLSLSFLKQVRWYWGKCSLKHKQGERQYLACFAGKKWLRDILAAQGMHFSFCRPSVRGIDGKRRITAASSIGARASTRPIIPPSPLHPFAAFPYPASLPPPPPPRLPFPVVVSGPGWVTGLTVSVIITDREERGMVMQVSELQQSLTLLSG